MEVALEALLLAQNVLSQGWLRKESGPLEAGMTMVRWQRIVLSGLTHLEVADGGVLPPPGPVCNHREGFEP